MRLIATPLLAGARADNTLHAGKLPVPSIDVTCRRPESRLSAAPLDLVDPSRRAHFAKERKQAGGHDREQEIGTDRPIAARSDLLAAEAAAASAAGAGERSVDGVEAQLSSPKTSHNRRRMAEIFQRVRRSLKSASSGGTGEKVNTFTYPAGTRKWPSSWKNDDGRTTGE
jgi:hypothetical protein